MKMAFKGVDNYVYRDGHRQLLGQATVIISDHHKFPIFMNIKSSYNGIVFFVTLN